MENEYIDAVLYLIAKQKPIYDPPYESPLEDLIAINVVKYLNPSVYLHKQYEIQTICGTFRIDFVLEIDGRRVGLECDGADYHDWNHDEWRDAMILGTNNIDFMYRLRGSDIYRHLEDILYIISQNHPVLFSQRGLLNLISLASEGARQYCPTTPLSFIRITYLNEDGRIKEHDTVAIDIRQRVIPKGMREMWQAYFQRAKLKPGYTLDELIKDYEDEIKKNTIEIEKG